MECSNSFQGLKTGFLVNWVWVLLQVSITLQSTSPSVKLSQTLHTDPVECQNSSAAINLADHGSLAQVTISARCLFQNMSKCQLWKKLSENMAKYVFHGNASS